jgi:hypothetical protein
MNAVSNYIDEKTGIHQIGEAAKKADAFVTRGLKNVVALPFTAPLALTKLAGFDDKGIATKVAIAAQNVASTAQNVASTLKTKSPDDGSPDQVHYCCSFLILFMICYILVYFLLDKFGKMFLQVFDYKADKTVIMFIIGSWVYYMFNSFFDYVKVGMFGPVAFMIGQFLYLCISVMLAPIAQMLFVVYFFYVFSGNIYSFDSVTGMELSSLKEKHASLINQNPTLFSLVNGYINPPVEESVPDSFWGTMNDVARKYVYPYFLLVLMILFFFYKGLESAITLKVKNFKWYFTIINFVTLIGLGALYRFAPKVAETARKVAKTASTLFTQHKTNSGLPESNDKMNYGNVVDPKNYINPTNGTNNYLQSGGGEATPLSITSILTGFGFISLVFVIPMSVILAKFK